MSNEYTRRYERPEYYTQTAYPDIFKHTYWGCHHGTPSDEIINNRARFVKQFGIRKVSNMSFRDEKRLFDILYFGDSDNAINYKKSEYYKDNDFKDYYIYCQTPTIHICTNSSHDFFGTNVFRRDHPEYYLSKKYPGCIIHIFSMHTGDKEHALILEDDYKELYPLYNVDQKTYIKIRPRFKKDYDIIDPFED